MATKRQLKYILDDYVRIYGPACPDPKCKHAHCLEVRKMRAAAE